MALGVVWKALGVLLERLQGRESARGEVRGDQGRSGGGPAAARGGVGEGISSFSPGAKGLKGMKGMKD